MKSFILIFFIFYFHKTSSKRMFGPYYIENEGIDPPVATGNPLSYNLGLTRSQYNKLIKGWISLSRNIGTLGIQVVFKRKSDGTAMNRVILPNLCDMDYPIEPFTKRFSGKVDEKCRIEAGNHSLTNWSLEDHIYPQIKSLFYGKFDLHLRLMENNETCLGEADMKVEFKDRDNRVATSDDKNGKHGENKEKNIAEGNRNQPKRNKKGNKNQGK